MIQTLKQFTGGTRLFDSVSALMAKLHIEFDRETAEPIDVAGLYDRPMPRYLTEALECIDKTYFIGVINDRSLAGDKSDDSLDSITGTIRHGGKYDGMFVFACDAKPDANLTRTLASALTRAFNRIAVANPVILIIRQGNMLSMATCERMTYTQEWRQGSGEKLGRVSILRNVNCCNPHRGHVDILETLGDKSYPTFEELYKHWMKVFSTELLVKKFYNELSDWYAWAIKVMKFPNALEDSADDQKYNAENGIRLVTRLIFIWFLKEKKLVPEEFFDVRVLQKIIKDFDPVQKENSLFGYMSRTSTYYQAIVQNLFFAMLNCPIAEDGNQFRGFRKYDENGRATSTGRGDPRQMRYKDYFADPDAFLQLAQKVPYLNGGLFDCLDDPDNKFYLDGFSDNNEIRKALCVPNFLFFGESSDIDLSEWYDDKQKKHLNIRGIIDILNSYRFTIEENTPYEQEVSLDPELLGKVFENMLASYNPETKTTARKSTGSYYTPREIVQYMVNESLVAYLKEQVDESLEQQYRQLLNYNDTEGQISLSLEQKKSIMSALYHCKVLDPACGSGAFPMGILQQMVHVLSKLDADNTIWKSVIETKLGQELASTIGHTDEERRELQNDINRNFDLSQSAPDYARKLYLIENCIYGIDIQTIAIQISKLRCFISLVVDQKVNDSPEDNYGIRPLPNLEARFVAANSLIGLRNDLSLTNTEAVQKVRVELAEANHRIFNAKTLKTKRKWRSKVKDLRDTLVEKLKQTGFVTDDDASLIASWDQFNQNCSSRFFDPEWMFGVKKFDIVIGNPPYIKEGRMSKVFFEPYKGSPYYKGKMDIWYLFACNGLDLLKQNGSLCFIATNNWVTSFGASKLRNKVIKETRICNIVDFGAVMMFESASIQTMIMMFQKDAVTDDYTLDYRKLMAYNATEKEAAAILNKTAVNAEYFFPTIRRANFVDKNITFSKSADVIGEIVSANNVIYLNDNEIAQGIVFPQDTLNRKNQQKLGENYYVGQGVFVLTNNEKKSLLLSQNELTLIKPYYTSENIVRYVSFPFNNYWAIYTDSKYKNPNSLNSFPNIKRHLDKFLPIFTSDNKPYGLHRAREERFFCNEKVIVLRKCAGRPVFAYCDFNCYLSQSFNMIQTERIDMKYLTGLLNSKLIEFWLKNKGKMQGANFQLDKEPLMQIPIAVPSEEIQLLVANLVDMIIKLKSSTERASNLVTNDYLALEFEKLIDGCICEIYLPQEMSNVGLTVISDMEKYFSEIQISNMNIGDVWPLYSIIDKSGIIERIKNLSMSKSESLRTIALS